MLFDCILGPSATSKHSICGVSFMPRAKCIQILSLLSAIPVGMSISLKVVLSKPIICENCGVCGFLSVVLPCGFHVEMLEFHGGV
jgi:hypothetical protein